jgi:hypothetical protein
MTFRINRLRAVAAGDARFSDLLVALPDGADRCLCCRRSVGHQLPDSPAMVLIADKSDDDPRVLCAVICPICAAVHPADQLLEDWAERLVERYGGTTVPDHRFTPA